MASGYKRDSRGRFNGGNGAGALGGKGAYVSRPNSGKGSRSGVTLRIGQPKGVPSKGSSNRRPKTSAGRRAIRGAAGFAAIGLGTAGGAAAGYGIVKGVSALQGVAMRRAMGTKRITKAQAKDMNLVKTPAGRTLPVAEGFIGRVAKSMASPPLSSVPSSQLKKKAVADSLTKQRRSNYPSKPQTWGSAGTKSNPWIL